MSVKNLIYIIVAVLMSASCSDISPDSKDNIALCASVGEIAASTKANVDNLVYKGTAPTSKNPLEAEVWFTVDNSGIFENTKANPTTLLPAHTTIKYVHSSETFPVDELKYPTDNAPVFCIGLYPVSNVSSAWVPSSDSKSVSRTITGTEDLMFAPQISGTWNKRFGTQTYSHLLSWVKICITATSADAIKAWGKIESISIEAEHSVTINDFTLTDISASIDNSKIAYTGSNSYNVFEPKESETGQELTTTIRQVGSVLCPPPVLEGNKLLYTVNIDTEHKGTKTVKIEVKGPNGNSLTSRGDAAGKLFILSLYFNRVEIIDGVCTLNSWNDQNEDL